MVFQHRKKSEALRGASSRLAVRMISDAHKKEVYFSQNDTRVSSITNQKKVVKHNNDIENGKKHNNGFCLPKFTM